MLEPNVYIGEIGLVNGYAIDTERYNKNGKLTKIKVDIYAQEEIEGKRFSYEYTNTIELDPKKEVLIGNKEGTSKEIINYYSMFDILDIYYDFYEEFDIYKIVITFLDAESGSKYDDICISEILLLGAEWRNNVIYDYEDGYIVSNKKDEKEEKISFEENKANNSTNKKNNNSKVNDSQTKLKKEEISANKNLGKQKHTTLIVIGVILSSIIIIIILLKFKNKG